jgi:hypothetical protein
MCVMVLAMDIIGDTATQGYKACPRSDRYKPATGQKGLNNLIECDASLSAENAACSIELQHSVHARHLNDLAIAIQGGITIAASHAQGYLCSALNMSEVGITFWPHHPAGRTREVIPSAKF